MMSTWSGTSTCMRLSTGARLRRCRLQAGKVPSDFERSMLIKVGWKREHACSAHLAHHRIFQVWRGSWRGPFAKVKDSITDLTNKVADVSTVRSQTQASPTVLKRCHEPSSKLCAGTRSMS